MNTELEGRVLRLWATRHMNTQQIAACLGVTEAWVERALHRELELCRQTRPWRRPPEEMLNVPPAESPSN